MTDGPVPAGDDGVLARAMRALENGQPQQAVALLEEAASGDDDPALHTALAVTLRDAGRHEDAVARLELAIARHPHYARAYLELGHLLVSIGRHGEAAEVLARGLEIAPAMPQLSIQLGYAELSRGDCAKAKAAFGRALEILPRSHDALFGMAKAHQEIGENAEAVIWFRRYLDERPSDAGAWLGLGHSLLELGDLDAGHECFKRAAQGGAQRYGSALTSLASAARGRFWLKPSAARRFLGD